MSKFKTIIKNIRIQRNLTQKQMSKLIGVTERTYQHYEAGTSEPPYIETLKRMAKVLDVSADYLIGLSDNPKR